MCKNSWRGLKICLGDREEMSAISRALCLISFTFVYKRFPLDSLESVAELISSASAKKDNSQPLSVIIIKV